MENWYPTELHTHTFHSDGRQDLLQIANNAKLLGLKIVAITDHNTNTALLEAEKTTKETGVLFIKAVEYTTFYGHFLNLGTNRVMDWRNLHKNNFDGFTKKLQEDGSIVGIAHPYRVGSPICTGCHFDYNTTYENVNYIEVWSGLLPSVNSYQNQVTFKLWDKLLNMGHKIYATSGRDWHSSEKLDKPICRNFLKISEDVNYNNVSELAINSIKNGEFSVSMAYCVIVEKISQFNYTIRIDDFGTKKAWEKYNVHDLSVNIVTNNGIVFSSSISEDEIISFNVDAGFKWLRGELNGVICDNKAKIGFSNPIFMD